MAWLSRKKISSRQLFVYIMLGATFCLFLPTRITDKFDHALNALVTPFTRNSRSMSLQVTEKMRQHSPVAVTVDEYQNLLLSNEQQQLKIANLEQELHRYREINAILSGLRQEFGHERATFIPALVTGSDSSNLRDIKLLDRGTLHQVDTGQIVLSPLNKVPNKEQTPENPAGCLMAVVGKIANCSIKTSRLQLLSDPDFCLKITIVPHWNRQNNWAADGMLYGHGMDRISVAMISTDYPVQPGDIVLARKDPKYLPVNMVIGTVKSCTRKKDPPLEWHILVKPFADLFLLDDVFVVKL